MNAFDATILQSLNGQVGRWPAFDHVVFWLSIQPMVKGAIVSAVIWGLWFVRRGSAQLATAVRERLLAAMAGCLIAEVVARLLAKLLPFRARPLHDPDQHWLRAADLQAGLLDRWSSFPSDHATLFFAVTVGVFFASRRAGAALLVFVVTVICLPRIYLGLHHPTDILAGAVLGTAIALLVQAERPRRLIAQPLLAWEARSPGSFYGFAAFFLMEFAVLFDGVRTLHALLRDHFGLL